MASEPGRCMACLTLSVSCSSPCSLSVAALSPHTRPSQSLAISCVSHRGCKKVQPLLSSKVSQERHQETPTPPPPPTHTHTHMRAHVLLQRSPHPCHNWTCYSCAEAAVPDPFHMKLRAPLGGGRQGGPRGGGGGGAISGSLAACTQQGMAASCCFSDKSGVKYRNNKCDQ